MSKKNWQHKQLQISQKCKFASSYLNRCALHGLIYLWDLKSTTKSLTEETKKDKIIEKEVKIFFYSGKKFPSLKRMSQVTMLSNLKWSDTDNFYMNLGCHKVIKEIKLLLNIIL